MLNVSNSLRPEYLDDFFGQKEVIEKLRVYLFSAKKRKSTLDHILFYGPPGLGKTTLAYIISKEMGTKIITITGSSIEKTLDLISILGQIDEGDILFIDEIHRLKKEFMEILYSAMEDYKINITYRSEENVKALSLTIPPFTLIGATTNGGNLTNALRDRFSLTFKFNYYKIDDLAKIAKSCSSKINLKMEDLCYFEVARRSRFTPRITNNLIKRINDYAIYKSLKEIKIDDLKLCFKTLKINDYGLNEEDIEILKLMKTRFYMSPISLEVIASYLNEDVQNIKNINEPFLVMLGLIDRTKRGRILTKKGIEIIDRFL